MNITVDEDNCEWQPQYDPETDILFGKYGLPDYVWRGKSIFFEVSQAPQELQGVVRMSCARAK